MAKKRLPLSALSPEEQELRRARNRAQNQRFRANNPDYMRAYGVKNRARLSAQQLARQRAHPAEYSQKRKQWRTKNIEKVRAQSLAVSKRYQAKHAEELRLRRRQKYLNNLPAMLAKAKANRQKYAAYFKAQGKKWRQTHVEEVRNIGARRRAREREAPVNDFTAAQWRALCKAVGYRCAYCDKKFTAKALTQDHIIPLARGGSHTLSNVIPACLPCNLRKNTKDVPCPVQPFLLVV